MAIAVVVLLALDLLVLLVLLWAVVRRRRSVKGRRGAFEGRLRVAEGELEGLSSEWSSGYGHWVRDVLVWNPAPLFVRTRLIGISGTDASGIHAAANAEGITGLGREAVVAPLLADRRSRLELATSADDRELALGPFARTSAVGSLVSARFASGSDYADDN